MKITVYDTDAGGHPQNIDVSPGTTVGEYFDKYKHANPANFTVRIDDRTVGTDAPLHEGCRMSISPNKVAGALT